MKSAALTCAACLMLCSGCIGSQHVLYFEPLSENERSVTLQVELSSTRGETARLRFPFVVEG